MAEFQRMPTQEELQKILYMGQMQGKTTQEIINENLNKGGTVKPLPENFFMTASAGAKRAGDYINRAGTAADVAKLFLGYQPETKVTIPTSFNVVPKMDPYSGQIGGTGINTQQMPIGNVLQQIKPADVLGVSGAERAYGDIGAGKAPQPMDVIDTLGLGASGMAAGKGLLTAGTKTAKYAAPVVGSAAENYAARTGLLQPIVPYEVAKNINMETKLPSSAEFASAVENTPGARITEDGLAIRLQRNQVPQQAGQESVRTGVFYLPEGSTNSRYYKNATAGYGGKEEITGETLLKNPLFVKGATGGKAPEMAFDAIKGKGAMKELDADVNRIVMGSSFIKQKDPALYQEMVSEFLQKYGSNPDTASYIIDNSKKGNQLKYALRENAIANAVRNAGHDAVLGYSKGKKGNFFSEVFDVRELDYPTVEGDFRLNPMYE